MKLYKNLSFLRFEVFSVKISAFWDVTPCCLVESRSWRQQVPPEHVVRQSDTYYKALLNIKLKFYVWKIYDMLQ